MGKKFLAILIFGIFLAACASPNKIALEYKEIVKGKIAQFAIKNVESDLSDDEYFSRLWVVIKEDALKYYQVGYPAKGPKYQEIEMSKYKARLRKEISWLREELHRRLTT
jgi:hypothetical protein